MWACTTAPGLIGYFVERDETCSFLHPTRCGFHNDLSTSTGVYFRSEISPYEIITAAAPRVHAFRRLSQESAHKNIPPARAINQLPGAKSEAIYIPSTILPQKIRQLNPGGSTLINISALILEALALSADYSILATQVRWDSSDSIAEIVIDGATSLSHDIAHDRAVEWRRLVPDSTIEVLTDPYFNEVKITVDIRVHARGSVVAVMNQFLLQSSQRRVSEVTSGIETLSTAASDFSNKRRLSWSTVTMTPDTTPQWTGQASTIMFETLGDMILNISIAQLLPWQGVETGICNTALTLFTEDQITAWLSSMPLDTVAISQYDTKATEHICNDTFLLVRPSASLDTILIKLEVDVKDSTNASTFGKVILPIEWKVKTQANVPKPRITPIGQSEVSPGASMAFVIDFDINDEKSWIDIYVTPCDNVRASSLVPLAYSDLEIDPTDCAIKFPDDLRAGVESNELEMHISKLTTSDSVLAVDLIVAVYANVSSQSNNSSLQWVASASTITSKIFHFCRQLPTVTNSTLYYREGEVSSLSSTKLVANLVNTADIDVTSLDSVSLIYTTDSTEVVGRFTKNDETLLSQPFNGTAQIVTLNNSQTEEYTYTSLVPGSFPMALMLRWTDSSGTVSDCGYADTISVATVPQADIPEIHAPFTFSRLHIQEDTAQIFVPPVQTIDQDELIVVTLSTNVSEEIKIEFAGKEWSDDVMDGIYYILTSSSNLSNEMVISVTPPKTFFGAITFNIEVAVVDAAQDSLDIGEFTTTTSTVNQVEVAWLQKNSLAETSAFGGQAVYQSLPLLVEHAANLSFDYRMLSGTSTNDHTLS